MQVDIKYLDPRWGQDWPFLQYESSGAAGLDLRACIDSSITLQAQGCTLIPSGLAIHIPSTDHGAFIFPRSGLGHKHGLILGNSTGVIDSDYQGEIKISCFNRSHTAFTLEPGMRIAQLIFLPITRALLRMVDDFSSVTERGGNGFGSTGTR